MDLVRLRGASRGAPCPHRRVCAGRSRPSRAYCRVSRDARGFRRGNAREESTGCGCRAAVAIPQVMRGDLRRRPRSRADRTRSPVRAFSLADGSEVRRDPVRARARRNLQRSSGDTRQAFRERRFTRGQLITHDPRCCQRGRRRVMKSLPPVNAMPGNPQFSPQSQ